MSKILPIILIVLFSLNAQALFEVKDASDNTVLEVATDGLRIFNNGDTLMVISSSEIKAFIDDGAKDRALSRSFSITTSTSAEKGIGDVLEVTASDATMHSLEVTGSNATMSSTAKGPQFSYFSQENLFLGMNAGIATTGTNNVFLGNEAGLSNTSGASNVFIGESCGYTNEGGSSNVFIGKEAGYTNLDKYWNTYIGCIAGRYSNGNGNSFVGYACGYNTTGDANSFFGFNAGTYNGTGTKNSIFGYQSGLYNSGGTSNCLFGYQAGYGSSGNSSYINNCLFGEYAGRELQSGDGNVMMGHYSGRLATSSSYNVFLGYHSAYSHTSGSANVFLGRAAGYNNQNGTGNIFIGNYAGANETGSSRFYLANGSAASPLIFGTFDFPRMLVIDGVKTDNPNSRKLFVYGSAGGLTAWYNDSDKRKKKNIKTIDSSLDKVSQLRGVTFEWNAGEKYETGTQMGFIAQEAEKVIPEVVDYNEENDSYGMQYAPITALLIEAVKELKKENETLKKEIEEIKKLLNK